MDEQERFDISVGSGIISIFQRNNYKLERVFSEFIDNALQSFLDHRDELEKLEDGKKCIVSIVWGNDKILIEDNAYGMNKEEFGRALKLRATNPNADRPDQLSVYGMGLKYAAVYLGNIYSISSSCYNDAKMRHVVIDVKYLDDKNPEFLDVAIHDERISEHYTKIKFEDLQIKLTNSKQKNLISDLGTIYSHLIKDGTLSISINGINVTYQEPEIRLNNEDGQGGKYFRHLTGSFESEGKRYDYSGFIGILNKGNQNLTGLNLIQAKRCIELRYKPEALFGKGNSFQNSRVFGEIVFEGDNYILSFNKDKFVWADDGTEDNFIQSLKSNPDVAYIIKRAKGLRDDDDKKKLRSNVNKAIMNTNMVKCENSTEDKNLKSSKVDSQNNLGCIDNNSDTHSDEYFIEINNSNVKLLVKYEHSDANSKWLNLDKNDYGYLLNIDLDHKYITKNFPSQSSRTALSSIAIILATSILKAQKRGLKLIDSMNILEVINNSLNEEYEN